MTKETELLKEIIQEAGSEVGMDSDECILHRAEHPNCLGCKYELGCNKLTALMSLHVSQVLYRPKNFDDFLESGKRVAGIMDKIMKATTCDEVRYLFVKPLRKEINNENLSNI